MTAWVSHSARVPAGGVNFEQVGPLGHARVEAPAASLRLHRPAAGVVVANRGVAGEARARRRPAAAPARNNHAPPRARQSPYRRKQPEQRHERIGHAAHERQRHDQPRRPGRATRSPPRNGSARARVRPPMSTNTNSDSDRSVCSRKIWSPLSQNRGGARPGASQAEPPKPAHGQVEQAPRRRAPAGCCTATVNASCALKKCATRRKIE